MVSSRRGHTKSRLVNGGQTCAIPIGASRATITHSVSAISDFVASHPPTPADRDHCLRLIRSVPNHPDHEVMWRDRFGITEVIGAFGMTEVNMPLFGRMGGSRQSTRGMPYSWFSQVEIRKPLTDFPLDTGKVRAIYIRPRIAHSLSARSHNITVPTGQH